MSSRLLLALDEHWPLQPACPWVVLGPDDLPLAEGHSEPRHWPAASTCEVLLCGAQVLWLEVALPALGRRRRRELPRLMAYALEDKLLSDPDTQHLTPTHRQSGTGDSDRAGVLVVGKDRLRTVLAQLNALGRPPSRMLAEVQTAPGSADDWHLSLSALGATLRTGPLSGVATDSGFLAPLLARHLDHARAANRMPARICVHAEAGLPEPDLAALTDEIGVPLVIDTPYRWWSALPGASSRSPSDLLHGEFAPREERQGWLAHLRPALALTGAALGIWLAASLGEVLWLHHQQSGLAARMSRVYQSTFPDSPAVAPAAQMRQQLALERERHGLLRHDDALALLAQLADALGTEAADSIIAARFEDGVLDLTLAAPALARADALISLLNARGLLASLRRDGDTTHLLLRAEILS